VPSTSTTERIFQELKRRKVLRVVASYAVIAFIALQVMELVFPALVQVGVPEWGYTAFVVLVIIGFPVTAVLSWVFEWTPQGLRAESPPAPEQQPGRKLADLAREPIDSLAVLPFSDNSPAKDQEYFVDGLTEALIGKLARIENLRVISRTSAMSFKRSDAPAPEIALKLGVRALVAGSVMRVGDEVHIEAQLIDAANDSHLWAESWDGKVADILALQSQVALTAAEVVRETLSAHERAQLTATPDIEPEVYNLYLEGLHAWNKCTEEGLRTAEKYFLSAVEADPDFALAHSGLADTYSVMMFYNYMGGEEALGRVQASARRAIRLDPDLAEAHCSLAWAHLWQWAFDKSEHHFLRALEINPNYANARHWYANLLCFLGRGAESIEQMRVAVRVDPLSAQISNSLGWTFYVLRKYGKSADQLQRTLKLDPEFANAYLLLGLNYLERGDSKLALPNIDRAIELDPGQPEYRLFKAYALARLGQHEQAREQLERSTAEVDILARSAIVHIALGDKEQALLKLEQALDEQPWTVLNLKLYSWYDPLRDEPRFKALIERLGLD
jgi:TolB-like protein/Tfp pilus assembly protein PilF